MRPDPATLSVYVLSHSLGIFRSCHVGLLQPDRHLVFHSHAFRTRTDGECKTSLYCPSFVVPLAWAEKFVEVSDQVAERFVLRPNAAALFWGLCTGLCSGDHSAKGFSARLRFFASSMIKFCFTTRFFDRLISPSISPFLQAVLVAKAWIRLISFSWRVTCFLRSSSSFLSFIMRAFSSTSIFLLRWSNSLFYLCESTTHEYQRKDHLLLL